jgi:hypothetical protein
VLGNPVDGGLSVTCFLRDIAGALAVNGDSGRFHQGQQIIGCPGMFWIFTAMAVVGFGSVLLGGCPFRQLVLAGQGNTDSALTVAGMAARNCRRVQHERGMLRGFAGTCRQGCAVIAPAAFSALRQHWLSRGRRHTRVPEPPLFRIRIP